MGTGGTWAEHGRNSGRTCEHGDGSIVFVSATTESSPCLPMSSLPNNGTVPLSFRPPVFPLSFDGDDGTVPHVSSHVFGGQTTEPSPCLPCLRPMFAHNPAPQNKVDWFYSLAKLYQKFAEKILVAQGLHRWRTEIHSNAGSFGHLRARRHLLPGRKACSGRVQRQPDLI